MRRRRVLAAGVVLSLVTAVGVPLASSAQEEKADVIVVGTGGTIAGVSTDETSFQTYRGAQLPIADMVGALPNLDKVADVTTQQFNNRGSGAYPIAELYDLSLAVDAALAKADGVVVTTGTDTMEEIAYLLDLTVRSPKPVVVTGAMRPWTVIGSDAPANLFNAIKVAASGRTEHFGTVILMNDEIHAARDVTKGNSLRLDTFESPDTGPLGVVDEYRVRVFRAPARAMREGTDTWATPFDLSKISKQALPRVEVVTAYQEAGGEAIDAFAAAGVKGIVTAGTGAGGISATQGQARTRAVAQGVLFMNATRTGSGASYGTGPGIIPADTLNPQHARLFLLLALAFSADEATVRGWAATYATPEVNGNGLVTPAPLPGPAPSLPLRQVSPPGTAAAA